MIGRAVLLGSLALTPSLARAQSADLELIQTVSTNTVVPGKSVTFTMNNSAFRAAAGTVTLPAFTNPDPIVLPGGDPLDPGPGSTYPSVVQVSGLTNGVVKATITVRSISHTWPDDIDLLLVGPQAQTVLLMSDCGLDNGATGVTITFDDAAAQSVPLGDPGISSGTFRPTNDGSLDDLPPPAPQRPFGSALSIFKDSNPNGTWALYAADDQPENSGFIADGWSLTLTVGDPIADLALTQVGPTAPVFVGSNLTYTITVTNRGPAITTALVQDALPASQSFVSANTTLGSCAHNAGTVTCDLGNLLVGQGARITLVVSPISGATSTNVVTVTGNGLDQDAGNNTASVVTTSIGTSDVAVNFASPASAVLTQVTVYWVVVTNNGPEAADGVTVTNLLPAGFTLLAALPSQGTCSSQPAQLSCSLGRVEAGASATVRVSVRPDALGMFTNVASIATSGRDPAGGNDTAQIAVEVVPGADLAVNALAPTTNVIVGDDVVSVFSITNRGPSSASVQFSDPLPGGFSFTSATTTHGSCTNAGGSVNCNLGTLLSSETATIAVVHRTLLSGILNNTGTATGTPGDPNPVDNSASVTATVAPTADLDLTVTDVSDPAWLGENLSYRMAVTNRGASTATAIVLTNVFPSSFTFIALGSTLGACVRTNNEIRCTLGSLNPGSGALVNLTVRPTIIGLYTNATSVMAAETDPVPQNNLFLQPTRVITSSGSFDSPAPITIPEFGAASAYPSTIFVSGLTSVVSQLRVTITNLNHTYPDDLDLLLVGPQGQSVLLMSDAGGEFPLGNTSFTFDDAAPNFLPDSSQIISGVYRPTNYEINPDTFAAPAPAGTYSTNLAVFRHTDPNGVWMLYIMDDAAKDSGSLLGRWGLTFYITSVTIQTITHSGTNVTLSFTTDTDTSYLVEYKNDLNDAVWTSLQSVAGNGGVVAVTDTSALPPMRFYRVRME
jgi:uncharacterized repeat protein (TIGR01451 family)